MAATFTVWGEVDCHAAPPGDKDQNYQAGPGQAI